MIFAPLVLVFSFRTLISHDTNTKPVVFVPCDAEMMSSMVLYNSIRVLYIRFDADFPIVHVFPIFI